MRWRCRSPMRAEKYEHGARFALGLLNLDRACHHSRDLHRRDLGGRSNVVRKSRPVRSRAASLAQNGGLHLVKSTPTVALDPPHPLLGLLD